MDFRRYQSLCHKVFPSRDGVEWERDCASAFAEVFVLLTGIDRDALSVKEHMDYFALRTITMDQIRNWLVLGESVWE